MYMNVFVLHMVNLLSHTVTLEIRTRLPKHIQLLVMCQYHAHAHTVKRTRPARPRDMHSYTFRHLFWPARPSVTLKSR